MCKKDSTQERLNILYAESKLQTIGDFAKYCDVSRSAMNNYLNEGRPPETASVIKICNACSVSADWLLGISDVKKPSADVRGICEYTGLNENTVSWVTELNPEYKAAFERFIGHADFMSIVSAYTVFLKMMEEAGKRFTPGTPGANIGVGNVARLSVKEDGTVNVSSIWQALTYIERDIGFAAESIIESDRLELWETD